MLATAMVCVVVAQLPPLTPKTVDEYLPALQEQESDYLERVEIVANAFLGVAYASDPLGEGPGAPYDSDPPIDLLHVDALSYVEQCLALAASSSVEEATRALTSIRYINGKIDHARRNHLIVEDWTINNTFVTDITRQIGCSTRSMMRFIERSEIFVESKAAPLFKNSRTEGVTLDYIWMDDAADAQAHIPDNSLIVFIGRKPAFFGVHCGLFLKDKETGEGKLYHASPVHKQVVIGRIADQFQEDDRLIGLLVYRIHPERMAFVHQPEPVESAPDS